mgnify:CR=1 FL=1
MKKVIIDKEQMLDNLIRKFGFEHSAVIDFATIMYDKNFNERMVADVYRGLIEAWRRIDRLHNYFCTICRLTILRKSLIIKTDKTRADKQMTTNKIQYMKEINYDPEYKITEKEFTEWLAENNMEDTFNKMLKEEDDYDIALDFSIPVAMVKYFRNK